jgi:hypothetical protein
VRFAPDRSGVAYRPGEVLVRVVDEERAQRALRREARDRTGAFVRFDSDQDPLVAVRDLALEGVVAQPNHVLLPHCGCCGPHPGALWANPFQANPFQANPFQANPFQANPFQANPFQANPFQANPFQANPFQANPFQANPFQANPFQANPFQANPQQLAELRATGRRDHSARPATAPDLPACPHDVRERSAPSVVVVDTGTAGGPLRPHALHGVVEDPSHAELPDEDGDGCLDPVAGHGTFIAGLVERIAPGCALSVHGLIGGYGDADEVAVRTCWTASWTRPPAAGQTWSTCPSAATPCRRWRGSRRRSAGCRRPAAPSSPRPATTPPAVPPIPPRCRGSSRSRRSVPQGRPPSRTTARGCVRARRASTS